MIVDVVGSLATGTGHLFHPVAPLLNVTATGTTAASYLTIAPGGQVAPLASSLNWQAGQTVPNAVAAKLSPGGAVGVLNLAGTVHVIADAAGWYG